MIPACVVVVGVGVVGEICQTPERAVLVAIHELKLNKPVELAPLLINVLDGPT